MRMRKKKNLEPRMEAVEAYMLPATSEELDFSKAADSEQYWNFEELFGNRHPVYLEVGCGKGQFVVEMAARHPEFNYVAVEKVANVIVAAAELAKERGLQNVRFAKCGAEYLPSFIPEHTISGIYLNFSCPFPKNSYKAHRLTNERFLRIYKNIMLPGAEIHQKTDNMHFFEYSIECFTLEGFALKNVSLDLHNSDFEGNIVTEYENRFASQGFPIYRLEAYLPNHEEELK